MKKRIMKMAAVLLCFLTVITSSSKVFAATACSKCGSTNVRAVALTYQQDKILRICPMGACSDWMDIWYHYEGIKCNVCGYEQPIKFMNATYTSRCNNIGWDYEVRKDWNLHNGHDIHESYYYWMNGSMY